ncbi:serine/threonine-protein kinase [Streptomyces sasae]|uniref:serine/threonine-protein kinase n=1 Tax=Streptomyces sasae TaxID=1266772 RepID=UPI00292D5CED|nr:serine/threonine-protein kinase [Streptomyces sasae]
MTPEVWQPGDIVLDLYEVLDVVHSGGMGLVHRVRHQGWNVDLAVKTPRPELVASPEGRSRFEAEAGTWVGLGLHPHTVNCAYVRTIDGQPRVFAEWVDGGSLAEAVAGGRLYEGGPHTAAGRVLDIAVQTAWGLQHAHDSGLVHQDVKPANVMLEPDGTAKVTDFGLAGARPADPAAATDTGVTFGGMTPAYCSPEQALAAAGREVRLTPATDVWSWALTVLEMFTGRRPTRHGQAAPEALEALLEDGPADPRVPAVPPAVAGLLRQCFMPNAEARPAELDEAAQVLAEVYGDVTGTPFPRRAPRGVGLLADGLSNQALSLLDLGRTEAAEDLWRQAADVDPHHLAARYNYGLHLWRSGRRTDLEVLSDIEGGRVFGGAPQLADRLRGFIHLEQDDRKRATESLHRATRQEGGPSEEHAEHEGPVPADTAEALAVLAERPPPTTARLTGHGTYVTAVAVTADGGLVLSGDRDGGVSVWDVETGRCLHELTAAGAEIVATAVDAAGRTGLVLRKQAPLEAWDLTHGTPIPLPPELDADDSSTDAPTAVALSGDGSMGATGHADGTLRFWDVRTGALLQRVAAHSAPVAAVTMTADGAFALSTPADSRNDQRVCAWNVTAGRRHAALTPPLDEQGYGAWGVHVNWCALSADSRYALQVWDSGNMVLWDARRDRVVARSPHSLRVIHHAIALAPGGSPAVVGSSQPLRVLEPATGQCLRTYDNGPEDEDEHQGVYGDADTRDTNTVAISADGRFAVAGSRKVISVLPLPAPGYRAPWLYARPTGADELSDGTRAFDTAMKQALHLFDEGRYEESAARLRAAEAVPGFGRHPDLREAWAAVGRHGLRSGLRSGYQLFDLDGHRHFTQPPVLAVSRDGDFLVTGRWTGEIDLWNAASGRLDRELDWPLPVARTLTMVCGDQATVIHGRNGQVALLDLVDDRAWDLTGPDDAGTVETLVYAPAANRLLTGDDTGKLCSWDLGFDGEQRTLRTSWQALRAHRGPVAAVALSSDGRYAASREDTHAGLDLASAVRGDEVCGWDLESGELLWTRSGVPPQTALEITPDGGTLLEYGPFGVTAVRTLTGKRRYGVADTSNARLLAIAPVGGRAVVATAGALIAFDLATGRVQRKIPTEHLTTALALTADGRFAVLGTHTQRIDVVDLDTGELLRTLTGHRSTVHALALSEDGRTLMSGDYDATVRGWELDWEFTWEPGDVAQPPAKRRRPRMPWRTR